jgi:hypothetical protein
MPRVRLRTFARGELLREVASAENRVRLASPFITRPIAQALASSAGIATERRLLTALVAGSVRVRALDPEALRLLKEAGWQKIERFAAIPKQANPEAKERWPYVTDIECVYEVPISRGVPLKAFDVTPSGLQGGYKELSRAQFDTAVGYLLSAAEQGR